VNHTTGYHSTDKELIDRVLRGDTKAFGIIIKNTENLVAQIVFKLVPVSEDRKDIAQDIYMKAFHNLPGFKFHSKLSTWIAQIAYNTCLSWIGKKKPLLTGTLYEDEIYFEPAGIAYNGSSINNESEKRIFEKELSGILSKEIDSLPPVYQTLIILYHQESMSYEGLSQITGLPAGTVKSYLFRARKLLKEKLLSKYKKEAL
jgi:RNA polymerase sigma factor (sigma-70 family)